MYQTKAQPNHDNNNKTNNNNIENPNHSMDFKKPALDIMNFLQSESSPINSSRHSNDSRSSPDQLASPIALSLNSDAIIASSKNLMNEKNSREKQQKQKRFSLNQCHNQDCLSPNYLDNSLVDAVSSIVAIQEQQKQQEELNQLNLSQNSDLSLM